MLVDTYNVFDVTFEGAEVLGVRGAEGPDAGASDLGDGGCSLLLLLLLSHVAWKLVLGSNTKSRNKVGKRF